MDRQMDMEIEEVCLEKRHISNIFRPVYMIESLLFFVPAVVVTILWHTVFKHIVGISCVFLGAILFMGSWRELVKYTSAPKGHNEQAETKDREVDCISIKGQLLLAAIIAAAYFVSVQIWFS